MNARRLHEFAAELGDFRDRLARAGDDDGAERLDELIARIRELADRADDALARLGNPPTDR